MANHNIYYIGGGASSLVSAILLKKMDTSLNVFIIEKNSEPLKKLKMTGNGKCNIAPVCDDVYRYNNPSFVKDLFKEISFKEYLLILKDLGIATKTIKDYGYYPISESAPNVASILVSQARKCGVKFINDEIVDYRLNKDKVTLIGSKKYNADKVIFALGTSAHLDNKETISLFDQIKGHGYELINFESSLCPVKVKEDVKELFGVRGEAEVSLIEGRNIIKTEIGEVMFKKDGLSGISIMNLSSKINKFHKYQISINFLNELSVSYNKDISVINYLLSLVKEPLARYLVKSLKLKENTSLDKKNYELIVKALRNMRFTVDKLYGFKDSQVLRGGISLKNINKDFSSKIEPNVYFIGEMLDIDGECGGYNLRYAITSGIKASRSLVKQGKVE